MPITKVKVNGEWIPAMPVGGGGEGDMTKAVYDTNDDGVVNAADQATKDGSGNVITSTYAAKATTLSGYGITDAKIENGVITLGSNTITPLTSVPVASVNGQTGTVVLDADDVGALPDNTPIPEFFEIEIAYIDSEEDYSLKTSASDIVAAYNAGKTIVGKYTVYESTSSVSPYFTSAIATIYANYESYENAYYFRFWDMFNTYEVVCWDDDGTLTASLNHYSGQFVTYQTVQDNVPNMQVYPTAYCETGGSYKTKIAKCTNWTAAANTYIHVLMKYGNITSNALTLNINNTGSKPIYINGTVSSSNNKALPAGSYLVFYNGVNFYFRTDGVLPQPTGYGDSVNPYTSKLANYILAGPTSGSAAAPSFRALVAADIPTLTASKLSDVSISNGTITIGSNTITPLTSFTESDPIFTASAAYGISSSDITNWNNKVSDTKTWGDVVAPDSRSDTSDNRYIPQFSATSSSSGTTATFTLTRVEPFSLGVPKWDYSNYLYAATPTSTDNSTKVATTAFVQTALGGYIASDTTANFTISDTAPSNPQAGDLWLDTNSQSASGIAYLPLSAGSNHPLSGDVYLTNNGTVVGKISTESNGLALEGIDSNGDAKGGIFINNSTGGIYVRPNGIADGTNEINLINGFLGGTKFVRYNSFGAGELHQIGHVCILHIHYSKNMSGWTAGAWNDLGTYSSLPVPVATTYGHAHIMAETGQVSNTTLNLRIDTTCKVTASLSATASTWIIDGFIVYWTA